MTVNPQSAFAPPLVINERGKDHHLNRNVIKAREVKSYRSLDLYAKETLKSIEAEVSSSQNQLESNRDLLIEKLHREYAEKSKALITQFQNTQQRYFSRLEIHCATIVQRALSQLVQDLDDDKRIRAVVHALCREAGGADVATLKLHENHREAVEGMTLPEGWTIEFNTSAKKNFCKVVVDMGIYELDFETAANAMVEAIGGRKLSDMPEQEAQNEDDVSASPDENGVQGTLPEQEALNGHEDEPIAAKEEDHVN